MALVGSSGGHPRVGAFERYSREGMANVVPSHVLVVFNLETKEKKAKVEKRLAEIAAEEVKQVGIVARVEIAINKKKAKIAEVAEQIAAV